MGVKLRLEGVSKSWEDFHLRQIEMEVDNGEYFVLLGPTGAGKTLLLETIMGYHTPDSGRITLNGRDLSEMPPSERNIGYVPQTPSLSMDMTVRENMEYSLKRRRIAEKWNIAVNGILQVMGLKEIEDRKALYLSGGERRKLALARVLITEPDAILLDEPLNSIDAGKKMQLQNDLQMIHRYLDLTVIHVTHDKQEAYSLGERMGIMINGALLQTGEPENIYSQPNSREVAEFLGYENIYEVKVRGRLDSYTKVDLGSNSVNVKQDAEGERYHAIIWNHDVQYSTNYYRDINTNTLQGVVEEVQDRGPLVTVVADIGVTIRSTVLKSTYNQTPIKKGDKAYFSFKAEDVKLIPIKQSEERE
ncbi:MAG: ATP-binding cassette domain-containing protein [Candidatus Bathyarchaeia archaeon]